MADSYTVARPYAKAVFELALQHQQVSEWSAVLVCSKQIVADPQTMSFIRNPSTTPEQQCELILAVLETVYPFKDKTRVENFLHLLAQNKRLLALPSICTQFDQLRATYEKTLTVDVISFSPLTTAQQQLLIKQLSRRLQREITLNIQIDESLQGGAIIRADHLVIDGSVATQIKKLRANLAA